MFFQFLLTFLQTTEYVYNRLILTTMDPSNQTAAIQFKSISQKKFRAFVPKVAASGPHLIILWT